MKKILTASCLAVAAVATPATAQEFGPMPFGGHVYKTPVGHEVQAGSDRAIQVVYDCLTNTFGNGSATHLGTCENVIEDINFAGSPWNNLTGRVVTEVTYGVFVGTTATTTEDIMVIFWDEDDLVYQGTGGANTPMVPAAAVPLAVLRVDSAGLAAGFYWQITNALTALPGGGVVVPDGDNGYAVQVAWVTDGFTPADANLDTVPDWQNLAGGLVSGCTSATTRGVVFGSNSGAPIGGNAASVGTTNISYGRDISNAAMCPNIGRFIGNGGAPVGAGDIEHRTIAAAPQRGMMVRFRGDVPPPPPPSPRTNLGCLADAGLSTTGSVAASSVQWYEICLNGAADDLVSQFLDIDTEGTSNSSVDVTIALYDTGGAVTGIVGGISTAVDNDSGTSTDDQLSFGVGRRDAVSDGLQYDGRNGDLPAGTYYLAVAPVGSTFAPGFIVNASANAGGTYNLNFATNTNGTPAAASVPPLINGQDYGSLVAGTNPGALIDTPLRGIVWHRFTLDAPVAAPTNFLDLDMNGSTANADTEIFLFDSAGNLVATDDDDGAAALSLLSFGCDSEPDRVYDSAVEVYTGQDGSLAAGTYYIAVGLFDVENLTTRWHVRGTSGSSLDTQSDLTLGDCGGSACDTIDFNNDGLFPDTLDIDDFLSVFSGGPCSNDPNCGDIDYNNDGLFPDTLDIDALLSVFSGGPCLI